jgi:hypothetical protein
MPSNVASARCRAYLEAGRLSHVQTRFDGQPQRSIRPFSTFLSPSPRPPLPWHLSWNDQGQAMARNPLQLLFMPCVSHLIVTLLLGSPHLSVSSSISIRFIFSVYFSIHSSSIRLECTHSLRPKYLNCRPVRHSARRIFISLHHHIRSRSGSSLNRQYAIHILRSVRSEHWLCSRYVQI